MADSLKRLIVLREVDLLKAKLAQGIIDASCVNIFIQHQRTYEVFKEPDSYILVYSVDVGNIYVIGSQQNCQISFVSLLRHINAQNSLAVYKREAKIFFQAISKEISEFKHAIRSLCHSYIHGNRMGQSILAIAKAKLGCCQHSTCGSHLNIRNNLTGHCHAVYGSISIYHFDKLIGAKSAVQYRIDQRLQGNLCSGTVIINKCVIIKCNVRIVDKGGCKSLHGGCHSGRIKGRHFHNDRVLIAILCQGKYYLSVSSLVKLIYKSEIFLFREINDLSCNGNSVTGNDSLKLLLTESILSVSGNIQLLTVDIIIITGIQRSRRRQYDREILNVYGLIISSVYLNYEILRSISDCKINFFKILYATANHIIKDISIIVGSIIFIRNIQSFKLGVDSIFNSIYIILSKNVILREGHAGNVLTLNGNRNSYLIRCVNCNYRRRQIHRIGSYCGTSALHCQGSGQLIKIIAIYVDSSIGSLQIIFKLRHSTFKLTDLIDIARVAIAHTANDLFKQCFLFNDYRKILAHCVDLTDERCAILIIVCQALSSVTCHEVVKLQLAAFHTLACDSVDSIYQLRL